MKADTGGGGGDGHGAGHAGADRVLVLPSVPPLPDGRADLWAQSRAQGLSRGFRTPLPPPGLPQAAIQGSRAQGATSEVATFTSSTLLLRIFVRTIFSSVLSKGYLSQIHPKVSYGLCLEESLPSTHTHLLPSNYIHPLSQGSASWFSTAHFTDSWMRLEPRLLAPTPTAYESKEVGLPPRAGGGYGQSLVPAGLLPSRVLGPQVLTSLLRKQ